MAWVALGPPPPWSGELLGSTMLMVAEQHDDEGACVDLEPTYRFNHHPYPIFLSQALCGSACSSISKIVF
jgi:hypothetical protein